MAQVRTFIAIGLSPEVREALAQIQERLGAARAPYAKWVNPAGIHLTLKFLGNIDEQVLPRLAAALSGAVRDLPTFRLQIGALGAFPSLRNPRVVWVGLEGQLDALQALQRAVEDALAPLGFPPEGRPFSPHLTLARVRETATNAGKARLAQSLPEVRVAADVTIAVDDILVMKSELARTGAAYTCINAISLARSRD